MIRSKIRIGFSDSFLKALLTTLAIILLMESCKKNDSVSPLPMPEDSLQNINRWVLDSMKFYYYYNNASINSSISLEYKTEDFFKKLLSPFDRFSWISNGTTIAAPKSCFDQYGFHYIIVQNESFSRVNLLGVFTLVAQESSAARSGIKRGFYFSKVNGQAITQDNYKAINSLLASGNKIVLTLVNNSSVQVWSEEGTKTLTVTGFEDRPVYITKIFEKSGVKTGYIFYKSFNEFFDLDLFRAFDKLKEKNVTELILDLRYNAGGSVATSAKLCALLSKVNNSDAFGIFKGNSNLGSVTQTFNKTISLSSNSAGKIFSEITSRRLNIKRVHILTTNTTASAAELVINNLKPYLPVIQIGEKTFGKDEAGLLIKDTRQPQKVAWYMQPIVFKLFNASNKGNYVDGIMPDMLQDEYAFLPLQLLNSPDDLLIKKALINIYGDNKVIAETLKLGKKKRVIHIAKVFFNSVEKTANVKNNVLIKL